MDDPTQRLASWLSTERKTEIEVIDLAPVSAGARRFNALFSIRSAGGQERLALTMIPTASIQLLSVVDEAAVRTLAEDAGVPVPHIHHVCTDESVLGGPFFCSTAVDGETVPRRVLRLVADGDPGLGERIVSQLGRHLPVWARSIL